MQFFVGLLVMVLLAFPAQAETLFFDGLSDVPIAPALQELPDRTLIFDKPSGRIAQITALNGGTGDAQLFYKNSLPQLGWQAVAAGAYVREGEKLTISESVESGLKLVVFRLEPR